MQKFFDCGIDLGTTNSCIAIPDSEHQYEIIENQTDRMSVTPSAVMINGKGRMLVGQRAYNSQNVEDLAIQFKRQMGTNKTIHFSSANIDKTPEDLSSEILKRLRSDVEQRLNSNIENVVITVPAAFRTLQSEATNKAGRLAGFKNIILLQEPIAAAVAYGVTPDAKDKCWMVFDYGGGTLDVAIVTTKDNQLEVINSEGDNYFGGSDIDRLLLNKIIMPHLTQEGYRIGKIFDEKTPAGKSLTRRVLLDCENCKIDLTNREEVTFELFDVDDDNGKPIEFECQITRAEFERLILPTVDKSIEIAKKALEGAKLKPGDIDKILLVGGSTFIPLVRRRLSETFNVPLDSSINPMTVVAAGAAIYASSSVIDVDDDILPLDRKSIVLNLTYEPVTAEEKVDVVGKITQGNGSVQRIHIDRARTADFSGVDWTSGWVKLLDQETGVFDIEVLLQKETMNSFKVFACDENGKDIRIENPLFQIKHSANSLKNSAPPATMSIGVKIQDPDSGYDIMDIVVKKNTPLPASAERTYKTTKDLAPYSSDKIEVVFLEGENTVNPGANSPAGNIYINVSTLDRLVPKGTEVELIIEEDENRNIKVEGYIPDFDYTIPSETLRPEQHVDMGERLEEVEEKIEQTEESIERLRHKGVNVAPMEQRLKKVKAGLKSANDAVDTNEAEVNNYIEEFYDFQTEVIQSERQQIEKEKKNTGREQFQSYKEDVEEYGDNEDKQKFRELEESYRNAKTDEEKAYVIEKMSRVAFVAKTNNFNWLRGFFVVVLAKPETRYTNYQKAEYWKRQAYEAINYRNTTQLRNSVFELLGLLPSSANDVVSAFGADLTR